MWDWTKDGTHFDHNIQSNDKISNSFQGDSENNEDFLGFDPN